MGKLKKKSRAKELIVDVLAYLFGSLLFAVSVNAFTAPNHIAPGGLLGVSTVLNYLFGLPIGVMIMVLNVPLLILAVVKSGWKFVVRTIVGIVVSSVTIDVVGLFLPAYSGDRILSAIFGGVFSGLGLAFIFMRGATTGGTDIVARLLRKNFRHIPLGRLMLSIDLVVVCLAALVYWNIESALYAIITIYVSSTLVDTVLYGTGSGSGKMLFIVSKSNERIAQTILSEMSRGVTKLVGKGGYTGTEGEVLLCAVRRHEITKIKDIVYSIDPAAFLIVGDAGDITGEGFGLFGSDL